MNDMSSVIEPKSDQLNADDLIAGPMTVTIREVKITPGTEQPVSIVLDGTDKFYRPCKSMSRVLVQAWGADAKAYAGRSLTLYRDPTVKWGGLEVGGIRISHMSHIDGAKQMVLTATRGSRKPFKVMPLGEGETEGPTQADALQAIEEAAQQGTDALKTAWSQKWVAPFREALTDDLERLKPIAALHDPTVAKADEIIAAVKAVDNVAAAKRILAENDGHYQALPDFLKRKVDMEAGNHLAGLGAKEDAAAEGAGA